MKIAIIGAGFTGLSSAYFLSYAGHAVTIFEKDDRPGGLAIGYQEKEWEWTLEQHYHHWFTNDKFILNLAKEINHNVIIHRPKTSSFVIDDIFQLDSPLSLLKFPQLNIFNRLRMGASLAFLRFNPAWRPLEYFRAEPYLRYSMGKNGYEKLWKPLMTNKLGRFVSDVSLAWFWARIYKRTSSLAYPEGGFLNFAEHLQKTIEKQGGKFYYNTEVTKLKSSNDKVELKFKKIGNWPRPETRPEGKLEIGNYDKVVVTLPYFFFQKIAPDLPLSYTNKLNKFISIGATNLILRLNKQFLKDNTYWLNMCDIKSPILAIVEHTNFMDQKHYNNEHLVYLGNYLPTSDPKFRMTADELLKLYDPYLKKINPDYKSSIISYKLFRAPFAQPIVTPNYSKNIPTIQTPLKNVYLANMQQVYPWDRGTNYAVELGEKVAQLIE